MSETDSETDPPRDGPSEPTARARDDEVPNDGADRSPDEAAPDELESLSAETVGVRSASADGPPRYDFIHPGHKFGADWPLLDLANAQAAVSFATQLGKRLQLKTRASADPIEHIRYGDFTAAHETSTLVHEISLAPLPGVLWLEFDASLVFALVDAYFGGGGQVVQISRARTLSNAERRVLAHVTAAFVDGLQAGWQALLPTTPELVRLVPAERLGRAGHEQIVARSRWMLAWQGGELPVDVTYPHSMLEPVGVKLERDEPTRLPHQSSFGAALGRELMQCDIELSGVVGKTRVSLSELLSMKPGDFIPLRDVQTVRFESQGTPVFDATLGVSNGCVSASLSSWHLPGVLSS